MLLDIYLRYRRSVLPLRSIGMTKARPQIDTTGIGEQLRIRGEI